MSVLAIVTSDGPANVGDLFVDLYPVGVPEVGYHPGLAVAGATAERSDATVDHRWLAYFVAALSDATWSASGLRPTVAS